MNYHLPPWRTNADNKLRKVGFELEFSGLEIGQITDAIVACYGGSPHIHSKAEAEVTDTLHGTFKVELDARLLKKMAQQNLLTDWNIENLDQMEERLVDLLDSAAQTVVPLEIVMPPITIDKLTVMEPLFDELRKRRAEGTEDSWIYAFGLHINPEVPETDAKLVRRFLQAFLLLYDWLVNVLDIDLTRRLTPFIAPFPQSYVTQLLDTAYTPDMKTLVDDYLEANPTRNRPLDMVPLFLHLEPELVKSHLGDTEKISARPTFHYRLPNSRISDPAWHYLHEWDYWSLIEEVAFSEEMIAELIELYQAEVTDTLSLTKGKWIKHVHRYLYEKFETAYWSDRSR